MTVPKAVRVAAGVGATQAFLKQHGVAVKSAKALNVSDDLLEKVQAMDATPEEVDKVATALSAFADFLREALGQNGEAKKPEKSEDEDVANKSFSALFGNGSDDSGDLNRDALGKAVFKPLGSSPGDARHRQRVAVKEMLVKASDTGRDASGRGRKLL